VCTNEGAEFVDRFMAGGDGHLDDVIRPLPPIRSAVLWARE